MGQTSQINSWMPPRRHGCRYFTVKSNLQLQVTGTGRCGRRRIECSTTRRRRWRPRQPPPVVKDDCHRVGPFGWRMAASSLAAVSVARFRLVAAPHGEAEQVVCKEASTYETGHTAPGPGGACTGRRRASDRRSCQPECGRSCQCWALVT
jgi:hypothetical protein